MDYAFFGLFATMFVAVVGLLGTALFRALGENRGVQRELATLGSKIDTLRVEMRNELQSEIGSLRSEMHSEIGSLRDELRVGMHGLSERLVAVETRLDSLESRFAGA